MQALDWNDLKFVLSVSRTRSLAAAARLLRVNETTVGRRINRVEQKLGARLFERSNGLLIPTASGEIVIAGSERIELETQSIEHRVSGIDQLVAGSVRLTSVPIVLNHIITPALPTLTEKHPELKIELISEPRDLSLTKREADIALRLARPTSEVRAITRKLGKLNYAVYFAMANQPDDLPWIQFEDSMRDLPQARWIAGQPDVDQPGGITVNDTESLIACLNAGLGKALLPTVIGDRQTNLIRLDNALPVSRELWIMIHPDLQKLGRIRAVVDWLADSLAEL